MVRASPKLAAVAAALVLRAPALLLATAARSTTTAVRLPPIVMLGASRASGLVKIRLHRSRRP